MNRRARQKFSDASQKRPGRTLLRSVAKPLLLLPSLYLCIWVVQSPAAAPPARRGEITDAVKEAEGLEEALRNLKAQMVTTPPLSPAQALQRFKVREGLAVDLIGHEPVVRQPLYLTFDERGRMWVVQYRQYPFPAGLKVVSYDQYIRAKFDKVPPPPPNHFKGADRITIHEDTRGNGTFDRVTTFLDGLNIATAALPGRGGVWVLNPPYLLFYPDPKRTDKPGRPVVHLSGFGLEDTHSVASSLCWGPDGWIYGAHGSTCTAKVKVEISGAKKTTDFLGQAIWRYHPERHVFELFAEGGGNTFGVAFDDVGRVYSGTNWGRYRGLHYVQGGYYVKGWGKHGPLTNPYALGFFDHMPHSGDADRLVHTFIVYGGDTLPGLRGKIVGVNPLQRRVQVTRLEKDRSSFRTVEEPFLLTTDDGRFRPVDVKSGPDGALYVADLYEPRINHVDPRDNWDRATGRIYRIRAKEDFKPAPRRDLGKLSSRELVGLLGHANSWYRQTALRLLGDRKDKSVAGLLKANLAKDHGQLALESLWALHQVGAAGDEVLLAALGHDSPHVRRWAVRLVPEQSRPIDRKVAKALTGLAKGDRDAEVRSQLASTAKRLPAGAALPVLAELWRHDEDVRDPHIPLLTWWALEAKAESGRQAILKLLQDRSLWARPLVEPVILGRLMQRWAMAGGRDNLLACAALLKQSPDARSTSRLLAGLEKGFAGRSACEVPRELRQAVLDAWANGSSASSVTLGLRLGHAPAIEKALALVADDKADRARRLACLRILGEVDVPRCVPVLVDVVRHSRSGAARQEALAALMRYPEARIGRAVLELYPARLPEAGGVRAAAHNLLASRPAWSRQLLEAIDAGKIDPRSLPVEVVRKMQLHRDREVARLLTKHYGRVRPDSPRQKQREVLRVAKLLAAGKGDARAGRKVYADTCGKCHKLFGQGGDVGPELTGYERTNAMYWMENIIDPSALIREEYTSFIVQTTDGRTLTGLVANQDKTTVSLRDQEGRLTRIARSKIDDMRASPVSLMPEGQLRTLKDQQVRDLFAYLMSKTPPK
jgi:putative heme-binding domain-containing protein